MVNNIAFIFSISMILSNTMSMLCNSNFIFALDIGRLEITI